MIDVAASLIAQRRQALTANRALLVAVSGIDGSGKGHVTGQIAARLTRTGQNVATIGIDLWQHPQSIRLGMRPSGAHFYARAFRWEELFTGLVEPLVRHRSVDVVVNAIRTDVDRYFPRQFRFENIDVVLLEGIFLHKREFVRRYDLRLWIDCSFETALARAHVRNQEGLSAAALERDYRSIYFPAQRLHLERDDPRSRADLVINNDPGGCDESGPPASTQSLVEAYS
jgi:uridine kinase